MKQGAVNALGAKRSVLFSEPYNIIVSASLQPGSAFPLGRLSGRLERSVQESRIRFFHGFHVTNI